MPLLARAEMNVAALRVGERAEPGRLGRIAVDPNVVHRDAGELLDACLQLGGQAVTARRRRRGRGFSPGGLGRTQLQDMRERRARKRSLARLPQDGPSPGGRRGNAFGIT
jgi:hypothetical protein